MMMIVSIPQSKTSTTHQLDHVDDTKKQGGESKNG
jgi:hypothetical protein